MTDTALSPFERLRHAYDALSRGDRAVLRRCKNGDAVQLEGQFWRLWSRAEMPEKFSPFVAAHIVSVYPAAEHKKRMDFRPGRFLADILDPHRDGTPSRGIRFRQLVRTADIGDLCKRLRRILAQSSAPVDWAILGSEIASFHLNARVRRQWIQDFYTLVPEKISE